MTTLDRDIAAFAELLQGHLARLIEAAHEVTHDLERLDRHKTIERAIVLAWRHRGAFEPTTQSVAAWFAEHVRTANREVRRNTYKWPPASLDERFVLAALQMTEAPRKTVPMPKKRGAHTYVAPPQQVGKECPPCWRCRFFDGWLPPREVIPTIYDDFAITAACKAIDERKVKIARYVRGKYPAALLED